MKRVFRNDQMFSDFFDFAGRRAFWAIVLIIVGGLLEGFGLLLLIPVIGLIAAEDGANDIPLLNTVFDVLGATSSSEKLTWVAAGFSAIVITRFLVLYRREMIMADLEFGFTTDVRQRIFKLIAAQPWDVSVGLEQGRIAHGLGRDLDRVTNTSGFWLRIAGLGFTFTTQLIIAIALAPIVTLGVIVFGGIMIAFMLPMRKRARIIGERLSDNDYQMFSSIIEFLRGLKPAKAHGTEARYLVELNGTAAQFMRVSRQFHQDITLSNLAIQSITITVGVTALLVGHLWLETPTATLVVVLLILSRVSGPIKTLQIMMQNLAHGRTAYESLMQHTADLEKSRVQDIETALPPAWTTAPSFTIRGVGWKARGMESDILKDVSAEVPAGKVTAIAGPSGAGKTTLCDLLVGLYEPHRGQIAVDGQLYDQARRRQIQVSLSYVGQESSLLQPTIREMLTWGTKDVAEADIWRELERVGIADQIRKEPDGLDQKLHGDVSRFSGGERQRMRLARALLRRPKLIVLDEATNALDPASESSVLEAIFAARDGATVIMVSHREETVRLADHVIRLEAPAPSRSTAALVD